MVIMASAGEKTCCAAEEDSRVQFLFGPGLTGRKDDFVDFKEVTDGDKHIFIDNDSRLGPELMTGTSINFYKRLDAIIGLEFAKGGQDVLDGVFFGLGLRLDAKVEIVGGYSRGLGKELSHGFQQAMGQFIEDNQKNWKEYPKLQEIELVDGVISDIGDYDGLPLYTDKTGPEKIFPGNPITNSFNSRFSVGILFRYDLWKQIKAVVRDADKNESSEPSGTK